MTMRYSKTHYFIGFLIILALEILIASYVNDSFIRPYLGDTLATILVYFFIMSLLRIDYRWGILISLAVSYLVEIAQYFSVITSLGLSDNRMAQILLGTSFSWGDMIMYSLGGFFIYLGEKSISKYTRP